MPKQRKQKFGKLSIDLYKAGEVRYESAYYPLDAARIATKWARKGWEAKVSNWGSSRHTVRTKTLMACYPASNRRGQRVYAHCTMTPAFKKRIRGL